MPSYEPDPFEDDEGEAQPRSQQSAPFKQLRDHARKLEKELKDRDKELEALRDFKAEAERRAKQELLRQAVSAVGLTDKHAELFQAARPDAEPTPEAVRAFAVEYGFISGPKDDDEDESDGGFRPTPPSGSPASKKRYTSEEFDELYRTNPVEAMKAAEEGRVEFQTTL